MGTRSLIGHERDDGSIVGIYCHWDGYPEWNGAILRDYYTDNEKVQRMLTLGDMSSLGREIGEKHPWDQNDNHRVCTFYGRDRNERSTSARVCPDIKTFIDSQSDAEYIYLWNGIGWRCYTPKLKLIDLTKVPRRD